MGRLTLRLPDSLHQQLELPAEHEAVSLNQYVVYALTRQATLAYTVQPVAEREPAEAEEGLTPEVIERLRQRLHPAYRSG